MLLFRYRCRIGERARRRGFHGEVAVGSRCTSRAALLLQQLSRLSRIFLLAFGLSVVALGQEISDFALASVRDALLEPLYSTHAGSGAETGSATRRGTGRDIFELIVDVPVPTEPRVEVLLQSDRATRDQVTGLVGSRDDLSLTSLYLAPRAAPGTVELLAAPEGDDGGRRV